MNPTMNEAQDQRNMTAWIIPGLAIGAAIGLAFAASRRKKSRWDVAREIGERVASNRDDLVDTGRNMVDRIKLIYEEGRKVVEEAAELWEQGRTLVKR
jgi:hypothetical protein